MRKGFFGTLIAAVLVAVLASPSCWEQAWAAEKVTYASAFSVAVSQLLPVSIISEQGLWKKKGLDVKYVPFRSGSKWARAMAAGHIDLGVSTSPGVIQQIARGVPMNMVAATQTWSYWAIWVLPGGGGEEARGP